MPLTEPVGGDSSIGEKEGVNWMFRAIDLLFDATEKWRFSVALRSNFLTSGIAYVLSYNPSNTNFVTLCFIFGAKW